MTDKNDNETAAKSGVDSSDWFSIRNGWLILGGGEYAERLKLSRVLKYTGGINVHMVFDDPMGYYTHFCIDGQKSSDLIDALDKHFSGEPMENDKG